MAGAPGLTSEQKGSEHSKSTEKVSKTEMNTQMLYKKPRFQPEFSGLFQSSA